MDWVLYFIIVIILTWWTFKKDSDDDKGPLFQIIILLLMLIVGILSYFLYDYIRFKEEFNPFIESYKNIKNNEAPVELPVSFDEIKNEEKIITIDGIRVTEERLEELQGKRLMDSKIE